MRAAPVWQELEGQMQIFACLLKSLHVQSGEWGDGGLRVAAGTAQEPGGKAGAVPCQG